MSRGLGHRIPHDPVPADGEALLDQRALDLQRVPRTVDEPDHDGEASDQDPREADCLAGIGMAHDSRHERRGSRADGGHRRRDRVQLARVALRGEGVRDEGTGCHEDENDPGGERDRRRPHQHQRRREGSGHDGDGNEERRHVRGRGDVVDGVPLAVVRHAFGETRFGKVRAGCEVAEPVSLDLLERGGCAARCQAGYVVGRRLVRP